MNSLLAQKRIPGIILLLIVLTQLAFGIALPIKKASATLPTADWMNAALKAVNWIWDIIVGVYDNASQAVQAGYAAAMKALQFEDSMAAKIEKALNAAWMILRKTLLDMLVDDIVKWIQGGGKPKVVTDWQSFLKDAADSAGGQFVETYLNQKWLCSKFASNLQIMLAKPTTFTRKTCTITQIVKNVDNFFSDFNKGGWAAWISISESQNNIYGAYANALDQKWGVEAAAKEGAQNEGIASAGFLGDKVCTEICSTMDANDCYEVEASAGIKSEDLDADEKCTKFETRTPGKIVADAATKSGLIDIDWLLSADEWRDYASAIVDAVINRVIKEGFTAMSKSASSSNSSGPGINTPPSVQVDTGTYQKALADSAVISELKNQLKLYIDNLNLIIADLKTGLDVLRQIKSVRDQSLSIIVNMMNSGCSVSGGSITDLTAEQQTNPTCNINTCDCSNAITKNISLTAPGVGTVTLKKTVRQTFIMVTDYETNLPVCQGNTSVNYENLSQTSIDQQIDDAENELADYQSKVTMAQLAIKDLDTYAEKLAAYKQGYDKVQNGQAAASTLASFEAAMDSAGKNAVASTQQIIGSNKTSLPDLVNEAQSLNTGIANTMVDVKQRRGQVSRCDAAQLMDGGYYKDLCDAQSQRDSYQTSYDTCLQQQQAQQQTYGP